MPRLQRYDIDEMGRPYPLADGDYVLGDEAEARITELEARVKKLEAENKYRRLKE